jgi:hypothetical protein
MDPLFVLVQSHGLVLKKPYVKLVYNNDVTTTYKIPYSKRLTVIHGSPNGICYLGDDHHDAVLKGYIQKIITSKLSAPLKVEQILSLLKKSVKPSIESSLKEMTPNEYTMRMIENMDKFFKVVTYESGSRKKNKEFAKTPEEVSGITIFKRKITEFKNYDRINFEDEDKLAIVESEFVNELFKKYDDIVLIDLSCSQSSDEISPQWDLIRGFEGSRSNVRSLDTSHRTRKRRSHGSSTRRKYPLQYPTLSV